MLSFRLSLLFTNSGKFEPWVSDSRHDHRRIRIRIVLLEGLHCLLRPLCTTTQGNGVSEVLREKRPAQRRTTRNR